MQLIDFTVKNGRREGSACRRYTNRLRYGESSLADIPTPT